MLDQCEEIRLMEEVNITLTGEEIEFLTSMVSWYLEYNPTNEDVAETIYKKLSELKK